MKNVQLDQAVTTRVTYADNAPILALQWSPAPVADENPKIQYVGATYTIDNNGGSGGKLRLILTLKRVDESGDPLSDVVTNIDGAVALTLKGLIDAVNKVQGFTAWALHAPHSFSVDSDDFTDVAATALPRGGVAVTETLQREVATANRVYLRYGNPTVRDNGRVGLLRLSTIVTNATGAVSGTVKSDPYGGTVQTLRNGITVATSNTNHIDNKMDNYETVRGPLLIEVGATNSTGAEIILTTVQAEG